MLGSSRSWNQQIWCLVRACSLPRWILLVASSHASGGRCFSLTSGRRKALQPSCFFFFFPRGGENWRLNPEVFTTEVRLYFCHLYFLFWARVLWSCWGWPWIWRSSYLNHQVAGITGMWHCTQLLQSFFYMGTNPIHGGRSLMSWLLPKSPSVLMLTHWILSSNVNFGSTLAFRPQQQAKKQS